MPIIDASALFDTRHAEHQYNMKELSHALKVTGFMILRNSEITSSMIGNVIGQYKSFFKLPIKEKERLNMAGTCSNRGWGRAGGERVNSAFGSDYKEFFDCGVELNETSPLLAERYYAPNKWPFIPDFKPTVINYYKTASGLSLKLLKSMAVSLGEPADLFPTAFTNPMSLLRGNYYPPRLDSTPDTVYGIAPHTDYGCLTLVVSDCTPGLEIQAKSGEWLEVGTLPGDCVVNFGEMLEMWSGSKVRATPHRVVGSKQERFSSAFFFNPNYHTNVSSMSNDETDAMSTSEQVIAGDYLSKRYNETYVHIDNKK